MELTPRPNVREIAPELRFSAWPGLSTPPDTPESKAAGQLLHRPKLIAKELLPNEILLHVFDLAVASAVSEAHCGYILWLTNVLSLGTVCRQWRRVMHGRPGPRLWRTIYVLAIRHPECLNWQLEKLRYSATHLKRYATTANLRLEIHVLPAGRDFDSSLRHEYLSKLKDLIWMLVDDSTGPCIFSRCNDIRIHGSVSEWNGVLCRLYPSLPVLDETVTSFAAVCYTNTLTKEPKKCPFPQTQFPFPSTLRSFTLDFIPLKDISWDWMSFKSLRSLDLYFHVRDPDYPDTAVDVEALGNLDVLSMHALLQNVSGTLETLRLGRWWTNLITPTNGPPPPPPIVLPHLTDLSLIWFDNRNMRRLIQLFSAANLQRALLQDVDMTEHARWLALPTFTESWRGLECLIIRLVNPSFTATYALRRLLAPLTGLRRLHVQFLHNTWENFYREYLQSALTDPAICPELVRFTFGYSSRQGSESQSLASSQVDSQSQIDAEQSQNASSQTVDDRDWCSDIGTPTEPDSQPMQLDDAFWQSSHPEALAEAKLSRLNTLLSMSEPDLTNVRAALEEMVVEEVPPFAASALTRQSSMNVSFRTGSQTLSIDEVSNSLLGLQGTQMSEVGDDADIVQTQEESNSQESMDRPIYRSWVADLALSTIANEMAARRNKVLPNTLRVAVIPLRNFAYDRTIRYPQF